MAGLSTTLTAAEMRHLAGDTRGPHLTIFQPTHRTGPEVSQGALRLKNLLREARHRLEERDVAERQRDLLVARFADLVQDQPFWEHQLDGLALLVNEEGQRHVSLPYAVGELVVAGPGFQLTPLVPLVDADGQYYLLALSQREVRLLSCTRHTVTEVDLPPLSKEASLAFADVERQLQSHATAAGAGSGSAAMFHGHGGVGEVQKTAILHFYRIVDRAVRDAVDGRDLPMVLAVDEGLRALYGEANTHPRLLPDGLSGNPDRLSTEELQERSLPVVGPVFEHTRSDALARLEARLGTGTATADLAQVVRAARRAQVDTLLVAAGVSRWGKFDESSGEIAEHDDRDGSDDDLVNLAAVHTYRQGGTVHVVEPSALPGGIAAALLRY